MLFKKSQVECLCDICEISAHSAGNKKVATKKKSPAELSFSIMKTDYFK